MYKVTNENRNLFGIYNDSKNKLVVPIEYDDVFAFNFRENIFYVYKNKKYYFLNEENKYISAAYDAFGP